MPNEVRAELQTQRASIRVQGEVVRQNDDGSIRVRTERGDIDVRVREGQQPPERGARVEIEIQPNRNPERPPETATVRELPRTETPQQRPTATPVDVEVRPQGEQAQVRQPLPADIRHAQNTNERAAQPLPPEGSVVRLQPLPARAAQALPSADILQQVVSTITTPTAFQAQVISQQAISDIQQAVLSIQAPATASPAPVLTASSLAAIQPEAVQSSAAPTSAPQVALNVQNLNIPVVTPVLAQSQPTTITALPISVQPQTLPIQQTTTPIVLKAQPLDVVIEKITPPEARILPGTAQTGVETAQTVKPENLILQNQNAGSLNGVVTNVTNNSLPVLTVFFPQIGVEQVFTLQFPSEAITIGTQIQVTPQTSSQTLGATLPQNVPLPVTLAPQPWPALDDVLQTLARAAPQAAQAMVNVTPSPSAPAQLGPAVMFFVAALRGGDLSQWLGEKTAELLKTQKGGNALNRLMGDGANMSRVAAEPMPQDWRAMNIPLYWDGDMHKIGLYFKHDHEDGSDEQSALKSTRFVFDLSLDQMGKVQLDGLFRPGRLDLVVRTEEHFAQSTQAEMRRIYAKALRETQVTGELSFQNQPESWVTIQADNKNALGVSA